MTLPFNQHGHDRGILLPVLIRLLRKKKGIITVQHRNQSRSLPRFYTDKTFSPHDKLLTTSDTHTHTATGSHPMYILTLKNNLKGSRGKLRCNPIRHEDLARASMMPEVTTFVFVPCWRDKNNSLQAEYVTTFHSNKIVRKYLMILYFHIL